MMIKSAQQKTLTGISHTEVDDKFKHEHIRKSKFY
jgi:hypothetical protein